MIFLITYQSNNELHSIEWVAPTGWDTDTVRQTFEQRFPAAEIIRLEPLP